jgi:molybdopterin-guanine dinucleotide biosynthesis adapter protein
VPGIVAIASDRPDDETEPLPVFPTDATKRIVNFMLKAVGLESL